MKRRVLLGREEQFVALFVWLEGVEQRAVVRALRRRRPHKHTPRKMVKARQWQQTPLIIGVEANIVGRA